LIRTTSVALNASTPIQLASAQYVSAANPKTVVIQNNDAAINVFIGGETRGGPGADTKGGASYTLSAANGFKLAFGQSASFVLGPSDTLYGIAASGTPSVIVFEMQAN